MSDFCPRGFVYIRDVLDELILQRFGDEYTKSILTKNDVLRYCAIDERQRNRAFGQPLTPDQQADDAQMNRLNARHSARWNMHNSVWNEFRSELLFGNCISYGVTDEGFIQVPPKVWAHAYTQYPPGYVGWVYEGMFVSGKTLIGVNDRDKLLASNCATAAPTTPESVVNLDQVSEMPKVGRPAKYDWLEIHIMIARELWSGRGNNQAKLIEAVQMQYRLKFNVEPSTTQLKKPAREFIAAYREGLG